MRKKNLYLFKFWAVITLLNLLRSADEISLSGLRGAKFLFASVSDRLSDHFLRSSNWFSCQFFFFRGQFRSADVPP